MSEKFKQLTKSINREALIKSLAFGLSCALFVAGLLLLIFKCAMVDLHWLYSAGIGVLSGGIVFAVTFLLFRKSEKAIAKAFDIKLGLQEKMQTMVEFENADGKIVQLQREQTERLMDEFPAKEPFFKRYLANVIAILLAVAMFTTGVLIPTTVETPPPYTPPSQDAQKFEFTTWKKNALTGVIEDVRASGMHETPKAQTIEKLEALYTALETEDLRSEMEILVIDAIVKTDGFVAPFNTYKQICIALDKSESQPVRELALAILPLNAGDMAVTLEEGMEGDWTMENLTVELALFPAEVYLRLQESQIEETDPLFVATKAYADEFLTLAGELEETAHTEEEKKEKLISLYKKAESVMGAAIEEQFENRSIAQHVRNKLIEIFEIDPEKIPELSIDVEPVIGQERNDGDDNLGGGGGGGAGDGEHVYGGSGTIYDPEEGHVEYGKVYDKYYKEIEKLYSSLSEEEREILSAYFAKLSNGAKQDSTVQP